MPLRHLLRVSVGTWAAIPMVVLAVLYAALGSPATSDPYPVALSAGGAITLVFIAPICAALGAWEGSRLRRSEWWTLPFARPRWIVAAWAVAPVIVAGFGAVAIGSALVVIRGGATVPDGRVLVLALAVVLSHTALGFAAGLWLPITLAGPAALIGSFIWLAFTSASEPLWLRHLTGNVSSCCLLQHDLAPAALAGGLLVAAGMVVGVVLLVSRPRWSWPHAAVAGLAAALAVGIAAVVVSPLGPDPAVARDPAALRCAERSGIRVCVWPEHEGRLEAVMDIAVRAVAGWEEHAIAAPRYFSEQAADPLAPSFGFSAQSTENDILSALAYSLLPQACPEGSSNSGSELDLLHAWFSATGGMADGELARRFDYPTSETGPTVLRLVQDVSAAPPEAQRAWLARTLAAASSCSEPTGVPTP